MDPQTLWELRRSSNKATPFKECQAAEESLERKACSCSLEVTISDFREAWCEPGVARVAVLGWGLWLVPPREKMVVVAKMVADLPERGGVRALRVTDISSGSYEDLSRRNGG